MIAVDIFSLKTFYCLAISGLSRYSKITSLTALYPLLAYTKPLKLDDIYYSYKINIIFISQKIAHTEYFKQLCSSSFH